MRAEHDRPSARAVERLATGVGEDVADLRTQLQRALDEAERLAADGRDDLAVTVLEEQREALLTVHQRLQARLADAAVEREAERVLEGAAPAVPGTASDALAVPAEPSVVGSDGASLRVLASAVAAVLGIVLLLSPDLDQNGVTAAGAAGASDEAAVDDRSSRPQGSDTAPRTSPPATPAEQEPRARVRGHLDALAIPDLPPDWHAQERQREADLTGAADLVPLSVQPSLDALTHAPHGLAGGGDGADGDPDAAGPTGDDGTNGDDRGAGGDPDTSGDGTAGQSGEGDEPPQDGTDGTATQDEDVPPPDRTDDGSGGESDDSGGGSSPGGDLDIDGTGEGPVLGR